VVIEEVHLELPGSEVPPTLSPSPTSSPVPRQSLQQVVEDTKRRTIAAAVDEAKGNWAEAARLLQLDRANLHRLARRLGMHK